MKYFHQKELKVKLISSIILFLLIFAIAETVSAQDMSLFAFGKGKIQVRLYADYFCGPCSRLEPKIEYLISDLVKRNIITITFIDMPLHKHSMLYAKYFLYVLNNKKTLDHALKTRDALFEAAKIPIDEEEKLEAFLQKKGFRLKIFDTKPAFAILQNYIRDDLMNSTPTCVILKGNTKEVFGGEENILKGLEKLK
jgi:thiol:disulfide interchange protein DsbA